MKNISKCVMAGVAIGIGCWVYLMLGKSVIGSVLFSFGLLAVCAMKLGLYTGQCGNLPVKGLFWNSTMILSLNWIGISAVGAVFRHIGDTSLCDNIITHRMSDSWYMSLILAVLCGWIMDTCVKIWDKSRVCGLLAIPLGVAVFINAGFVHSVADWFYIIASTKVTSLADVSYMVWAVIGNFIGCNINRAIK